MAQQLHPQRPAVDEKLANIVNDLCTDHLPKTKLDEVLEKYARPDNCTLLVAPKINIIVWQQLKQPVRTADGLIQKAQKLLLSAVCAILKASETVTGDVRTTFTHALVLAMSSNREINLRRRDALQPHLNFQYSALCDPSTPITTELFGDDITKEIDELAKSSRLGNRLAGPRKGSESRFHPYGTQTAQNNMFHKRQNSRTYQSFFGDRGSYRRRPGAKVGATQLKKLIQYEL